MSEKTKKIAQKIKKGRENEKSSQNIVEDIPVHSVELPIEPKVEKREVIIKPQKSKKESGENDGKNIEKRSTKSKAGTNVKISNKGKRSVSRVSKRRREGILERILPPWF